MKTTVTVTVLKAFDRDGQHYTTGQAITVSPIEAIVLSRKRQVTLAKRRAVPPPPPPPPEPTPEPPKARRAYKRRDLVAEETSALEPES